MIELPTIEMPQPLLDAVAKLRSREEQSREAEQRVAEATEAVEAGHQADVRAIAQAREEGKRDPSPEHEQKALAALRAAEHELEVESARLETARRGYEESLETQREPWRKKIESQWRKVDRQQRRRLADLQAGVDEVHRLSVGWRFLYALDTDPADAERVLRKAAGSGGRTEIDFSAVASAVEAASCEVVTREATEARREWDERLAEDRRAAEEAVEEARAEAEREVAAAKARREALGLP